MSTSMPVDRLLQAMLNYSERFNATPPMPFGVSDDWLAQVLEQAVADGEPIPAHFNWYPDLPEGAVA